MKYEDLAKTDKYSYILLHRALGQEGVLVKKGDLVVPTEWAIQNMVLKEGDEGTIAHTPRGFPYQISVIKKGNKTVSRYWSGFWRKKNYKFGF